MKKILLFLSLFAMVFASCENEDVEEIFNQSPEQRVSEQLNAVRADLKSNEMGWLSTYTFNEGTEELVLLIKFIDDKRAEISAPETGEKMESSYVLNYTQQVDLIFDTHNLLAKWVDNKRKADFRWELDKQEDGQYFFKSVGGQSEGQSELNMVKASTEKLQTALKIQVLKAKMRPNYDISYFRVIELASGERYDYSYIDNKVIFEKLGEIKEGDDEAEVIRFESEITLNDNGFVLTTPFVVNGKSISEFEYDEATKNFKIINNADVEGGINFANSPAIMPLGLDSYMKTANYLLYVPSISKDNCSPVFQNYLADLKTKGYSLDRMEMSLATKRLYININGDWHTMGYSDVKEDGLLMLTYAGSNIKDDDLFNALLPIRQAIFGAKGQYFINENDYYQYKGFSFLSKDYPNMKIHMIALR